MTSGPECLAEIGLFVQPVLEAANGADVGSHFEHFVADLFVL
jgi:hypothetical protein